MTEAAPLQAVQISRVGPTAARNVGSNRMPADIACDLIGQEMIPYHHGRGQDHYVEALSEALDALQWRHLREAPRDGTWIMLVVKPAYGLPGYVGFGHWVEPPADAVEAMGRERRERYAAAGGWWSSSPTGKPLRRGVLAWRPMPVVSYPDLSGYQAEEQS